MHRHLPTHNSSRYLGTIQDNNRHQQTPTDTKQHQQAFPGTQKRLFKDVRRFVLTSNGVWWYLMASIGVFYCLMLSLDVRRVSKKFQRVSECCLWTDLRFDMRDHRSAQASYGTANFTHLAVLKHRNTKTCLYNLSKTIGLIMMFLVLLYCK